MNLISEDYLMHHGVKGMKWGVRKQKNRIDKFYSSKKKYDSVLKKSNKGVSDYWSDPKIQNAWEGKNTRKNRKIIEKGRKEYSLGKNYKDYKKARQELVKSFSKLKVKDLDSDIIAIGKEYGLSNRHIKS